MRHLFLISCILLLNYTARSQGYKRNNNTKDKQTANKENQKSLNSSKLGKNIIAFSPLQILMTNANQTEPDLAINFSYERVFDNEHISFRFPVCLSLQNNYSYLLPGVKFYPTKQGNVKYAVGPQFLFGNGKFKDNRVVYNPNTGQYVTNNAEIDRRQFGFLINNSLNITLVKSIYIGLDASLGIIYYDNLPKDYYNNVSLSPFGGNNSSINTAFQFHFNGGFRF